ncbi:MAG: hypothetical protein H7256_00325 [Bdellovibrio sp.]|nr:hypothetical protein [Bdellovibrio sp.]
MKKKASILILVSFLLTLYFQSCGLDRSGNFSQTNNAVSSVESGNGDGYTGKPTPYDFRNLTQACVENGANGKPLPNEQIFIFPSGVAQLVRQNCMDISPILLDSSQYSVVASGSLIYKNRTFVTNLSATAFDVVAASCPVGKTLLANPNRTSLVNSPIDLLSIDWARDQLQVKLQGSLASLPVYKVERVDPYFLESWHRMNQSPYFVAGQDYVFSFFVKMDATEKMMFTSYYSAVQDLRIEFDLLTGAANVNSSMGVSNLTTKSQVISGALYINIYFRSNSSVNANIGLASSGQFIGSFVTMTALQLEKISNFCSP